MAVKELLDKTKELLEQGRLEERPHYTLGGAGGRKFSDENLRYRKGYSELVAVCCGRAHGTPGECGEQLRRLPPVNRDR